MKMHNDISVGDDIQWCNEESSPTIRATVIEVTGRYIVAKNKTSAYTLNKSKDFDYIARWN